MQGLIRRGLAGQLDRGQGVSAGPPLRSVRIKSSAVRRRYAGGGGTDQSQRDRDRFGEYKLASHGRLTLPPHCHHLSAGDLLIPPEPQLPLRAAPGSPLNLPSASLCYSLPTCTSMASSTRSGVKVPFRDWRTTGSRFRRAGKCPAALLLVA